MTFRVSCVCGRALLLMIVRFRSVQFLCFQLNRTSLDIQLDFVVCGAETVAVKYVKT